jgi:hypothetical protein
MEPGSICYRVHKNLPLVSVADQMGPAYTIPHCLFMIHFKIILPSAHSSKRWPLSFRFLDENINVFRIYTVRTTYCAQFLSSLFFSHQ